MGMLASRQELANLWREGAQITRPAIFGNADSLRPVYDLDGAITAQIDIPAMGMVGPAVGVGSFAFLSVNPAGGSSRSTSSTADTQLYDTIAALRAARSESQALASFEKLTQCFLTSAPTWRIWHQYIGPILDSLARGFADVSYLYLVPFRTIGDAGSRLADPYTEAGYRQHLKRQLDALRPRLIIAVDRPSERRAREWAMASESQADVFYFTRKRDAHVERKSLLDKLRRQYAA